MEPPVGKGDPFAAQTMVECRVRQISALELGMPTKPKQPPPLRPVTPRDAKGNAIASKEAPPPPPPPEPEGDEEPASPEVEWTVSVCAAVAVALAPDPAQKQALETLRLSWESGAPGRAAKAKGVRESYLAPPKDEAESNAEAKGAAEGGHAAPLPKAEVRAKECDAGDAALYARESKDACKAELQGYLEERRAGLEVATAKRQEMRDARAAAATANVAEAAAARGAAREVHAAALADATALMIRTLPEPPEPVVPDPKEKKKGKK